MNASFGAKSDKVTLIKERRPRPNEAQVPGENAEQLRQFIQTGSPEESAGSGEIGRRVREQVRGNLGSFQPHGAELRHPEDEVVSPNPHGPMDHRSLRRDLDEDRANDNKG